MNKRTNQRRRTYLLRDSSQPHMILVLQGIYLLLVLLGNIVLYASMQSGGYLPASSGADPVQLLLPTLITLGLGGLVVTSVTSVLYTRRIAGPVYRLRHIMRDIGDGNLTQFAAFRKGMSFRNLPSPLTTWLWRSIGECTGCAGRPTRSWRRPAVCQ